MNKEISNLPEDRLNSSRKCKRCKGKMQVKSKEIDVDNSDLPEDDQATCFICDNCNHEVLITDSATIITAIVSALFIIFIEAYALINGFVDFLVHSFSASIGFSLLAVFLSLLFILFAIGAWVNLTSGVFDLFQRYSYPKLEDKYNYRPLIMTLSLGIFPWLLAAGLGYINYQFFDDNEAFATLMLVVVAVPIFLAPKFNVTFLAAFLACALWGVLGAFIIWLL